MVCNVLTISICISLLSKMPGSHLFNVLSNLLFEIHMMQQIARTHRVEIKTVSARQVSAINVNREKRRTVGLWLSRAETGAGPGGGRAGTEHGSAAGARPVEELSATSGAVRTARRARAPAAAAQ
jgi:hypothetical protein